MTKPSASLPSEPDFSKETPKAAASLANVKVRRRDSADQPPHADKPGDLTQVLAQRRAGQSEAEPATPSPRPSPDTDADDQGAAPDNGPTLRDRLTAQRLTVDSDQTAPPPLDRRGDHGPAPTALRAEGEDETPAADGPVAPDPTATGSSARSGTPESAAADPGRTPPAATPPPAPRIGPRPAPEPSEEREARSRRGKKRGKEAEEEALRKRMEAALRAETRRREQAAARQNAGDAEDAPVPLDDTPMSVPRWTAPQKQGDIYRFWSIERHGRDLPALSNLDLDEVAGNWPDSLLLRVAPGSRHMELEKIFSRDIGKDQPALPENKIDYTPDVIDWVLSQGQVVLREGGPVRATEEFETERGIARYRVVALPLGEDGVVIDHILCQLEPV